MSPDLYWVPAHWELNPWHLAWWVVACTTWPLARSNTEPLLQWFMYSCTTQCMLTVIDVNWCMPVTADFNWCMPVPMAFDWCRLMQHSANWVWWMQQSDKVDSVWCVALPVCLLHGLVEPCWKEMPCALYTLNTHANSKASWLWLMHGSASWLWLMHASASWLWLMHASMPMAFGWCRLM